MINDILKWVNNNDGIFSFGTHKDIDESIFNTISNYITSNTNRKFVDDVSYIKSFSLKNSIFIFRTTDVISGGNPTQDSQSLCKMRTLSDSCKSNNNVILLQSGIYTTTDGLFVMKGGGSSIMMFSSFFCILSNGKISIQKLRWDNSDDYQDVDILDIVRDYKLNQILK
jgi:hypothetical protein